MHKEPKYLISMAYIFSVHHVIFHFQITVLTDLENGKKPFPSHGNIRYQICVNCNFHLLSQCCFIVKFNHCLVVLVKYNFFVLLCLKM